MPTPPPDEKLEPAAPARRPSTRARPTTLLIVAGVLLAARAATGIYEHFKPPRVDDLIKWTDVGAAETQARAGGKPILYDFTAAWCAPCKQMKKEVFASREHADYINQNFVPVKVADEADDDRLDALRNKYRISGLPTLLVVRPGSEDVRRSEGYAGRAATLAFLTKARIDGKPEAKQ